MTEKEIWKDVDGFPGYKVSSFGNARCYRNFSGNITNKYRTLKPILNKDDYFYVDLYTIERKQVHKRIHRLVADTFLGVNPNLVVNHIDGNKHNNKLSNLEWVTSEENSRLAAKIGLYKTRPVKIVETGETFDSIRKCAKELNVHPSNINQAISGKIGSVKGLHFEYCDSKRGAHKEKEFLYPYQLDAVNRMHNGCILCGGVGSGKSRTSLYYYFTKNGGSVTPEYFPMKKRAQDLYIITTAKKRDSFEWEQELSHFLLSTHKELNKLNNNTIVIDSWNNIGKYSDISGAFFIFDEQRLIGNGAWVKAFLKIAKLNEWILLSATPADCWEDYIPVFIANGFYRNKTEFSREHLVYSNYCKFPKVERYLGIEKLEFLRDSLLVDMDFERKTTAHHEDVYARYDISKYKDAIRLRWDPYKNEPIQQAAGLCYVLRRIVNEDTSRQVALLELFEKHPRMIVFYNFDYELDILKGLYYGEEVEVAEWNGHKHQPVPDCDRWVYLVQYTAGAEGWNCITTDTIVFYSQNYSYKIVEQSSGRIDRLNTPFTDLFYYHLKTRSGIDLAISKALHEKKKFNERKFTKWN